VFEKLGPSLYDFLRRNEYQPFPIQLVQHFCRQLLEAIAYMHELTLIHTDLKPENILLAGCNTVKEVAAGSTENRWVVYCSAATISPCAHNYMRVDEAWYESGVKVPALARRPVHERESMTAAAATTAAIAASLPTQLVRATPCQR
jgi:hypothetical protein